MDILDTVADLFYRISHDPKAMSTMDSLMNNYAQGHWSAGFKTGLCIGLGCLGLVVLAQAFIALCAWLDKKFGKKSDEQKAA